MERSKRATIPDSPRKTRRTLDTASAPTEPPPPSRRPTVRQVRRPPGAPTMREVGVDIDVALKHAMAQSHHVAVVLRSDGPHQPRTIEGIPLRYRPTRDGRQRVVFEIADGAEQTVLFDRILSVDIH